MRRSDRPGSPTRLGHTASALAHAGAATPTLSALDVAGVVAEIWFDLDQIGENTCWRCH